MMLSTQITDDKLVIQENLPHLEFDQKVVCKLFEYR